MKWSRPPSEEKAVLSYPEASRILNVPLEFPDPGAFLRSFSIDTRTLQEGELFIALAGQNTDGHDHVAAAFEKGASGALIDIKKKKAVFERLQPADFKARNLLVVADPLKAMTELAVHFRSALNVKTIGVTGSVGKTTTKEFLYFLLRQKYQTIASSGNLNNHLGVPIMLSRLRPEHQYAVLELGASHLGEIAFLSKLIKPVGAVLTPIGPAHLAGFGSLGNVYQAKTEIVDFLEKDAPLVIPDHDEVLRDLLKRKGRGFILAGASQEADCRISDVIAEAGTVRFLIGGKWRFSFPGSAPFLALNAALAIAMAVRLGVPMDEMPQDWRDAGFASGRFRETILLNGIRVIDDSYNASPLAFSRGLEAFELIPCRGKKFLIFADMLELGDQETLLHRQLGEKIAKTGIDYALAYGDRSRAAIDAVVSDRGSPCEARHFRTATELAGFLKDIVKPGDLLFLKGSRGMRVEKVLERVRELIFEVS